MTLRSTQAYRKSTPSRKDRRRHLTLERLDDRVLLTLTPSQIRGAYGIDQLLLDGTGQTIAIVDEYDDPNIVPDLHQFDVTYGLPDPTLTKVAQDGSTNYPSSAPAGSGWGTEISLDVEWAHAVAPKAKILLVETAPNTNFADNLDAGVVWAAKQPGVSVVSMSWGSNDFQGEASYDSDYQTPAGHAGVTFVAASGDFGTISYPAASPNVLAVGGTTLTPGNTGTNYGSETAWNYGSYSSGGGVSQFEPQPAYQQGVVSQSSLYRTSPDVAYNASAVFIYDSYDSPTSPWLGESGTSAGAPQWAALIALADQGRANNGLSSLDGASQTLPMLYHLPTADFHDITSGSNNGYNAGPGYDLVTGRGSPLANLVVPSLENDNKSFATPSDGTNWSLGSDGTLRKSTGAALQVNQPPGNAVVKSIVVDGTGQLDALTSANDIWRYVQSSQSWVEIDNVGDVRTLVVDAAGRLNILNTANDIWRYVEGTGWTEIDNVGNVRTLVVDGGGRLDILDTNDNIFRYVEGTGWQVLDNVGDVQKLVVDRTGQLDILNVNNDVFRYIEGTGWQVLYNNNDADNLVVDGGGRLDILTGGGNVDQYIEGTGWLVIDSVGNVKTLVIDGTGRLDILTTANDIWRYTGGTNFTEIDNVGDVKTLVVDSTGQLDILNTANDIWRYVEGTGWTEIDSVGNVTTLVVDGTGRLDIQTTANDIWRYFEVTGWTEIDSVGDVKTLVVDGTGRLDILNTASDVWRYIEGSTWTEIDNAGDVKTLVVDGTGSLWVWDASNDLDRYIEGTGWTRVDASADVQSIASAADGSITVNRGGVLWRYTVTGSSRIS